MVVSWLKIPQQNRSHLVCLSRPTHYLPHVSVPFSILSVFLNRSIEYVELKNALLALGLYTSDSAFDKLFPLLDADGDGEMSFDEFHQLAKVASVSTKVIDYMPLEEIVTVEVLEDEESDVIELSIRTTEEGLNRGRMFVLELPSDEAQHWNDVLRKSVSKVCGIDFLAICTSFTFWA